MHGPLSRARIGPDFGGNQVQRDSERARAKSKVGPVTNPCCI